MPASSGRFLRENAFLVAAVALPLAIVGLFLLVTAIPRWTVPAPAYDLLLQTGVYDSANSAVSVDFIVDNDRLHARIRPSAPHTYPPRPRLWLFDHTTLTVREVSLGLPRELAAGESTRTVPIDAVATRRVVTEPRAPDGYELQSRTHRSTGLFGDLFGMGRYNGAVSLVNRGRVVPIRIGSRNDYVSPQFVGWLVDEGAR
jgi:hypothetical protein